MSQNQSTFEKDYALVRNAAIYSILPRPIKWAYKFCLFTLVIAAIRWMITTPVVHEANWGSPRDLNGCDVQWAQGIICHHNSWQPLYDFAWNVWHVAVGITGYAYLGIC